MLDAFFQRGDLAEPRSVLRLDEALLGVVGHLVDAAQLGGVDAQEPASGAGVFVHAGCAVGAVALAEGHPAQQEVFFELGPLVVVGDLVLPEWAQLAAPFDERLVGGDEVLGKHRGVATGGVEVEMSEQRSGDVQRQAAVDGVGGEQAAEVVRGEVHRLTGIGQPGDGGEVG